MPRKLIHGIIIGLLSSAFAIALWFGGWLNWLESASWDFRVRTMAKPGPTTDDICIIALDQYSLDFAKENFKSFGYWPWARDLYTPIIDFCTRAGAKAVVFDVFFTEPSRIGVEDDQKLGESIATNKRFIVALTHGATAKWPAEIPAPRFNVTGINEYLATHPGNLVMPNAAFSIPEVSTNAIIIGHAVGYPDPDGKVRRTSPLRMFDNHAIPSLGLAAFLVANQDAKMEIRNNSLFVGQHTIPLNDRGGTILNFRGPAKVYKIINAAAVLNSELRLRENGKPEIDPASFKGKYIFFGFTAPGLLDLKATPVSKIYPGVAVHATFLDNLLSNDFIKESSARTVILLVLLFGMAAGIAGRFCQNGTQSSLTFLLLLPFPMLLGFAAYSKNIWLNVSPQELSIAIALVSAAILNYATEGRQKRFIKSAFKQYLSSEVIEKLVNDPSHLKLGGETRELSIFFSDVAGFTGISEILGPEQLTALLNEYLTSMTDIIYSEGGTIDKYEGDAIIAFWNAPLDLADHPKHAVMSAIRCNKKLEELRPILKEKYGRDLFARIGINTGKVVVGNMGSTQRFNYTFLGDAGNLASRLEGQNKTFGTSIMISEFTFKMLGDDIAAREISSIRVVGKKVPIRVYEPMIKEDFAAKADLMKKYGEALQLYYKGQFKEALAIFSQLSSVDAPSASYVKRCKDLIDNPPENWDGVWEMKEK